MRFLSAWVVLLFCSCGFAGAQTLEETLAWSREELTAERKELSELRDLVVDEKIPIARELREIREKLVAEQENKRQLDAQQEGGSFAVDQLKSRQSNASELAVYLANQAIRFRQNFEADLVVGERFSYADTLLATDRTFFGDTRPIEQAEAQWTVIDAALDRLESLAGGSQFETEAVSGEGVLVAGAAIQFGPLAFFKGAGDEIAGNLAESESLQPQLISLNEDHTAAVRGLFSGEEIAILVDPTLGQAALIQQETVSLFEHLTLGGFWMIPICLFGLLALMTSIFKWVEIRRVSLPSIPEFEKLREQPGESLGDQYRGGSKRLAACRTCEWPIRIIVQ
jgi:hypothetical protein